MRPPRLAALQSSSIETDGQNSHRGSEGKMRLNGWQRIGIVASVCWLIGGGLWINARVLDTRTSSIEEEYNRCLAARSIQPDGTIPRDTDWGPCISKFKDDYLLAADGHLYETAVYTLIPIPIVWALVYGLIALRRWIRVGVTPSRQNQ